MHTLATDEGSGMQAGTGDTPDLLAAALAYSQGDTFGMAVRVFPLAAGTKVPAISKAAGGNGVHDATTSRDQVVSWWTEYPTANVGLATGAGLLAVDVDVKGAHDGPASLAEAMRQYGSLPDTAGQVTPSGGYHLLYAVPLGRTIRKAVHLGLTGVDLQYDGRYVVAAPSQLHTGGQYRAMVCRAGRFDDRPNVGQGPRIAPAPWWLLEPVLSHGAPAMRVMASPSTPRFSAGEKGTPEGLAALDGLCDWLARQGQGNVNDGLNWAAYQAGGYVAGGHLDYAHAEAVLTDAARRAGHDLTNGAPDPRAARAMEATLASGIGKGMLAPADPLPPAAEKRNATRVKGLGAASRTGSRVKGLGRG